jgi:hypothetical protein
LKITGIRGQRLLGAYDRRKSAAIVPFSSFHDQLHQAAHELTGQPTRHPLYQPIFPSSVDQILPCSSRLSERFAGPTFAPSLELKRHQADGTLTGTIANTFVCGAILSDFEPFAH